MINLMRVSVHCRGPAGEWYDAMCLLLRQSKSVREWFAKFVLFSFPDRFSEYLLECPSGEVRLDISFTSIGYDGVVLICISFNLTLPQVCF